MQAPQERAPGSGIAPRSPIRQLTLLSRRRSSMGAVSHRSRVRCWACSKMPASRRWPAASCPDCAGSGCRCTPPHPPTAMASRRCCFACRAACLIPATRMSIRGYARVGRSSLVMTTARPCCCAAPTSCGLRPRCWATTSARCACSSIRACIGRGRTIAMTRAGCGPRGSRTSRSRSSRRRRPHPTLAAAMRWRRPRRRQADRCCVIRSLTG